MDLEAVNLTLAIGDRTVVASTTLACRAGTVTTLVGPSGCGKTTLLHGLGLLITPSSGDVLVAGKSTRGWRDGRRRRFWRDHAAFVLQDYGIMDDESVAFNVSMQAGLLSGRAGGHATAVRSALDSVGLMGRDDEPAAHLSGGEKQRLAIARAIYKDARIVYVDEPTASLDDDNRSLVVSLLAGLARNGKTVVVATHDDKMVAASDAVHRVGDSTARGTDPASRDLVAT